MRKRHQEPIWQPKHTQAETTPKTPALEKMAAHALSFRKLLLELSLIAVAVIGLGLLIKEVLREEIIVEPIEIPDGIAKQGYTGIVIAEQIADAALARQQEVRDLSEQKQWFKKEMSSLRQVATNMHIPDITPPGAPFSLRTIARFIRHELNLPSTYIRGELTQGDNKLSLTLRNLSESNLPAIRIDKNSADIQTLILENGDALLKLTSPSVLVMRAYFEFYEKNQDNDQSGSTYKQFIEEIEYCLQHPPTTDDAFVTTIWGVAFNDLKRRDEALEKFKQAVELDPKHAFAFHHWGYTLDDLNRYDEAIEKYKKAIELDPMYGAAFTNWGYTLENLKRYDEAIEKYQKAVKINPKDAFAFNNWGHALQQLKRYDEAIAKYQKAVEIDPKYVVAIANWGNTLYILNRNDEAIAKYQKAVEIDPKDAFAYFGWANALYKLKRYDEAIAKYQKVVELNPKDAFAYFGWANALDELKRYDEAIAKYQKVIEIDPKYAYAFHNWGLVLEKKGKTKEAEEKFKKAKELEAEKSEKAVQKTD